MGLFLSIPILMTYNGEKGRSGCFSKWMFYLFYPLLLPVIGLIKLYLI